MQPENLAAATVPGTIIHHQPAETGRYIGSPGLAVLPNGDYVASHDEFGPKSTQGKRAVSHIYRSRDQGKSWSRIATLDGAFWSTLFFHRGALYLLGTDREYGNVVIRRSQDGGTTWTEPRSSETGLLRVDGEYHCAPVPIIEHRGRLWRAIEWRNPATGWGIHFRAGMMSIPVEADLLDTHQWTFSDFLPSDRGWNGGDMGAWLEGNAVVTPRGEIVDILRVQTDSPDEKAAIVSISADGSKATFDPATGFIPFPGGAKKFTIRYDPRSQMYWSLATIVHERHRARNPGGIRNTLALTASPDMMRWEVRSLLLYHPDVARHGFQYVEWLFDGEDIIAACRTAYEDNQGGAHNHHDANYLTFHRFPDFRRRTMADSVPLPERTQIRVETPDFVLVGSGFEMARLADGEKAFSNRAYVWKGIPDAWKNGQYTRTAGGQTAEIRITAKRDTTVHFATALSLAGTNRDGWTPIDTVFSYTDRGNTAVTVHRRSLRRGEEILVPQGNWTGGLVLIAPVSEGISRSAVQ